ncbi:MAG TPA: hypothetical protein VF771_06315, partial [Longimicrobiaceae bacterium]
MIIPGTYITVRAEGLISAGRIATGIVGVVGTASSGPVGQPVTLSGFANARETFGLPDDFDRPVDGSHPLTLTRALQHIYGNGASTVIAVRVASATAASASYAVKDADGHTVATLTAVSPGTWANDIQVSIAAATAPARITGERQTASFSALKYHTVRPSPETRIQVTRGDTRRVDSFDVVYRSITRGEEVTADGSGHFILAGTPVANVPAVNTFTVVDASGTTVRTYGQGHVLFGSGGAPALNEVRLNPSTGQLTFEASQVPAAGQKVVVTYAVDHAAPLAGQVLVTAWDGTLEWHSGEAPSAANGDVLTASYLVEPSDAVLVTLVHGPAKESYTVPDGNTLAQQLATSAMVRGVADGTSGGNKPADGVSAYFGTGGNTRGANGADAGAGEYGGGLEALENMLVNIVHLAGQDADTMGSVLVGHLKATEETDFERIG